LVILAQERIDEAARVLAHAFVDDPPMIYYFPDAHERARQLPIFFATMLRDGLARGEVWATPGTVRGVAIWLPPDTPATTEADLAAAGFAQVARAWGVAPFERMMTILLGLEACHLDLSTEAHWHLGFLGVAPEAQGTGIGGGLVRQLFPRADAAGLPCYLDTMLASNVARYERLGFAVVAEQPLIGNAIRLWTMRRPPNAVWRG
jgi:GNAT superfamily N-acetyltransferase